MIDPDSVDPFEVLAHLKHLGYKDITGSQLKEFMHDLRKLIKYEQKYGSISGRDECSCSTVGCSSCSKSENESNIEESNTERSDLCSDCNASKYVSACDTSSTTSETSSDNRKKKTTFCQQIARPQSSFIRPWRLQPSFKVPTVGSSLKSDPVQLYHRYKELWAQQKVPGENRHAQLRWTIREKMLGQDPHPRPISQASTECRSRSMYCK